jgi:hypothetical protein
LGYLSIYSYWVKSLHERISHFFEATPTSPLKLLQVPAASTVLGDMENVHCAIMSYVNLPPICQFLGIVVVDVHLYNIDVDD